jgi:hypothetical protein
MALVTEILGILHAAHWPVVLLVSDLRDVRVSAELYREILIEIKVVVYGTSSSYSNSCTNPRVSS